MYHNTDDYLRGIHRSPVDSPHKGSQGGKCFHAMASSCNTCTPWPFWSTIQSQAINLHGDFIYYVLYTTTLGHCWRKHERLWLRVHRYGCIYSVLPCRKAVLHLSSLGKKYVYHHRENPRSTSNISCLISALNVSKPLCRWYLINVQKCEHLFHLRGWSILLTSNGSWCIGIKDEMSGTVCVTFTWDIYISWVVYSFCLFCCLFIIVTWWYMWCIVWQVASKRKYRHVW